MSLTGRTAIVTGGAGGIGMATVAMLARSGATVVIADVCEDKAADEVESLRAESLSVHFKKTDVTVLGEIRELVSHTARTIGEIDILVNCAGVSSLSKVMEITPEEWDSVFCVNLRSAFFCSQEVLKRMTARKHGRIINIASASGKIGGVAVGAHYSASKAGIICLTKSLALYGAPFGINVNCVCPGPVNTVMTETWGQSLNSSFAKMIPLKRYGTAEEVAQAIGFLVSEEAAYITGEILDVNGGLVMD